MREVILYARRAAAVIDETFQLLTGNTQKLQLIHLTNPGSDDYYYFADPPA
jgi:hypothetical protein